MLIVDCRFMKLSMNAAIHENVLLLLTTIDGVLTCEFKIFIELFPAIFNKSEMQTWEFSIVRLPCKTNEFEKCDIELFEIINCERESNMNREISDANIPFNRNSDPLKTMIEFVTIM